MIHNLSNLFEDSNFDTFYKISIIEATQLPYFDSLAKDETILSIVNSIPQDFQAMVVPFLPEKFSISSGPNVKDGNMRHRHSISFPLLPQDKAIKDLLDTYNNKLVVAFVNKRFRSHLYGTSAQPLRFSYDELHAPGAVNLKGFTLNLSGETYGPPAYFEGRESDFPVVQRGLSFQLAGSL